MDKKQKKEPGIKEWAVILAAGAFLLLVSMPDLFQKEKELSFVFLNCLKETIKLVHRLTHL